MAETLDGVIHAPPPKKDRFGRIIIIPEQTSQRLKDFLNSSEELFEKNGTLDRLRVMAAILRDSHPIIEIEAPKNGGYHSDYPTAVFRTTPELVGSEERYELPVVKGGPPKLWRSKGIKIEIPNRRRGDQVISFIHGGSYDRDADTNREGRIPGGWTLLDESPGFQESVRKAEARHDPLNFTDKLQYALSLSTPYFDHRRGDDPANLVGASNDKSVTKRIDF
jgi:hypothetical protein